MTIRQPYPSDVSDNEWAFAAGCFEAMAHDLRLLLRGVKGRKDQPSAAIFDSRVLQSTPESGGQAASSGTSSRLCSWAERARGPVELAQTPGAEKPALPAALQVAPSALKRSIR